MFTFGSKEHIFALRADVLRAVAVGAVLEPGSTLNAGNFVMHDGPLFDGSPGLKEFVM